MKSQVVGKSKADAEGYAADCVADVFHQVTLKVRFRRRGENQVVSAAFSLSRGIETCGEVARKFMSMTVYRGYGRMSYFMSEVQKLGMSFIFAMSFQFTMCNTFVAQSTLNCER